MSKDPGVIRTPENRCLHCDARISAVAPDPLHNSGDQAGPNDITQCIRCGAVMALDDQLRLRPLTDLEESEIRGDPELMDELFRRKRAIDELNFIRDGRN